MSPECTKIYNDKKGRLDVNLPKTIIMIKNDFILFYLLKIKWTIKKNI